MTLPGVLVLLAVIILLAGPVLGLVFFTRDRAQSVKLAEVADDEDDSVVGNLTTVYYQREIVKRYRLDRHDAYIWMHAGLWLYGWGVILSDAPNSNLTSLTWATQQSLGLCLLVGSTMGLAGVILGARIGRRRIMRRVSHNMLSPMLGDDIRFPYTLACAGLLSVGVSMSFYAHTIWATSQDRLLGTLGGGLSMAFVGMCITLGIKFIGRIRDYSVARDHLLTEALARMDRDEG